VSVKCPTDMILSFSPVFLIQIFTNLDVANTKQKPNKINTAFNIQIFANYGKHLRHLVKHCLW